MAVAAVDEEEAAAKGVAAGAGGVLAVVMLSKRPSPPPPDEQEESDWQTLPADLLRRVCELAGGKATAAVAKVCRSWRDVAASDELWQDFCAADFQISAKAASSPKKQPSWKATYAKWAFLPNNWKNAQFRIQEHRVQAKCFEAGGSMRVTSCMLAAGDKVFSMHTPKMQSTPSLHLWNLTDNKCTDLSHFLHGRHSPRVYADEHGAVVLEHSGAELQVLAFETLDNGTIRQRLEGVYDCPGVVTYADSRQVVYQSGRSFHLRQLPNMQPVNILQAPWNLQVRCYAVVDGDLHVAGYSESCIVAFNVAKGNQVCCIAHDEPSNYGMCLQGNKVGLLSEDELCVWDVCTGRLLSKVLLLPQKARPDVFAMCGDWAVTQVLSEFSDEALMLRRERVGCYLLFMNWATGVKQWLAVSRNGQYEVAKQPRFAFEEQMFKCKDIYLTPRRLVARLDWSPFCPSTLLALDYLV
eukprot:jgi/Chlat1/8726/Chrsp9S08552